jgi:virulence-associated protein VagC
MATTTKVFKSGGSQAVRIQSWSRFFEHGLR